MGRPPRPLESRARAARSPRRSPIPTPRPTTAATAVIVAAGRGRRLAASGDLPKPLVPVVGVPLIARVMASAAKAGVRRFVVVVGHRAELLRERLGALVPAGCELRLVDNPRYELPNGVSLLAAARELEEPFALLMSDHLFSPDRLRAALERFAVTGRDLLVVRTARRSTATSTTRRASRCATGAWRRSARAWSTTTRSTRACSCSRPEPVRAALEEAGEAP